MSCRRSRVVLVFWQACLVLPHRVARRRFLVAAFYLIVGLALLTGGRTGLLFGGLAMLAPLTWWRRGRIPLVRSGQLGRQAIGWETLGIAWLFAFGLIGSSEGRRCRG